MQNPVGMISVISAAIHLAKVHYDRVIGAAIKLVRLAMPFASVMRSASTTLHCPLILAHHLPVGFLKSGE